MIPAAEVKYEVGIERTFVLGVQPRGEHKVVVVLQAFCDESGIDPKDTCLVVVGFLAKTDVWGSFEGQWRRATGGVTFHAKKFFGRNSKGQRLKPYTGWSDAKAESYIETLARIIREHHRVVPFGSIVDVRAFRALTADQRRFVTGALFSAKKWALVGSGPGAPAQPYFLGFVGCIARALTIANIVGQEVHFVFDVQNQFSAHALNMFRELKRLPGMELLGQVSYETDDKYPALQAADLLGHVHHGIRTAKLERRIELSRVFHAMGGEMSHTQTFDAGTLRSSLAGAHLAVKRKLKV